MYMLTLVTSRGDRLSAHLLSLHNRAGVAGNRSALKNHRLKYKAQVQIRHLFFIYKFKITIKNYYFFQTIN